MVLLKHPALSVHRKACLTRKNEEEEENAKPLEPTSKKTRVEGFALPEGSPKTSSPLYAQELLPDSESSLQSKAPQYVEEEEKEVDVEEDEEEDVGMEEDADV
ncbi:Teneurin-2 [Manis pentadactyla]|nr:Teneurin-2 [Manis pentadactyla]